MEPQILRNLGLVYVPVQVALYGLATLMMLGYGITRAETLRQLTARAEQIREGEPESLRS